MVLPNLWQANHDPSRWATPDTLNPGHFLLPGGDQLDPAATRDLMTFSTGVRYCPGKDMAFANSFVVLGTMLLRYDFNMVDQPEDWIPQRGLTLKPKHYTITLSHV